MQHLFVPYSESIELKHLGFDEECLGYYTLDKDDNKNNFVLLSSKLRGELVGHGSCRNSLFKWLKDNDRTSGELYTLSNSIATPLYQQAFGWFREKHGFDSYVFPSVPELMLRLAEMKKYSANIYHRDLNPRLWAKYFDTHEECELACLQKLIEIVKTK